MKLKNILLCTLLALVLAPVAAFARGPCFSLSLNMIAPPPRPYVMVHPCPPPPPPPPYAVMYYPHTVYPNYYYPYVVHHGHCHPHHHGYYVGR